MPPDDRSDTSPGGRCNPVPVWLVYTEFGFDVALMALLIIRRGPFPQKKDLAFRPENT